MSDPYSSLQSLLTHLLQGWSERVEFRKAVFIHSEPCQNHREPKLSCDCPTVVENRVMNKHQLSLCRQLTNARLVKTVSAKDGPAPPGKSSKKPPPPGNLIEPDEIRYQLADIARSAVASVVPRTTSRSWADDAELWLYSLTEESHKLSRSQLSEVTRKLSKCVRDARIILGYESSTIQFAETVCADCGGALAAERISPTQVVCVGGPLQDACGRVYPYTQWAELLLNGPVLVDTKTASLALGRPAATLYRWASTGKVKRYGNRRQGGARWDLAELKSYQQSLDNRSKTREDTS